ncbi:cytochrome P450 [Streptomyces sp. RPT161]|uniref:cytochrome P450 n=1 Tax=Streptomyces sp. RPT161 TaxID=3015993 RepID=UPI0022B8E900|nr:cytochrome P450 [Streptomyces sp. RPT161]
MDDVAAVSCPFDFRVGLEFDPLLRQLMSAGPVTRIRMPYGDAAWLVTDFEGVRQVTTDHRFSRAAIIGRDYPRLTPKPIVSPESINVMDPPHSSRLRRLASQAFTKPHVDRMRPAVERIVDTLLDEMVEHGPPADLVHHLSEPLPQRTICELLVIPPDDWPMLQGHVHEMLSTGHDTADAAAEAKAHLRSYFEELTARRRRSPGDDLISNLAAARDGDDAFDDQELAVMALTLMMSGHDTATCQISNIAYMLLTNPERWAILHRRRELLPGALEELLRFIPFRTGVGIPRVATQDVEVRGVTIRAGDFVHVSYLTANRDPSRYRDPDSLDLERPPSPNMAFGWGGHHCIAVPLAMAELQAAVGALLTRFPRLRLAVAPQELQWNAGTIRRFPCQLPVSW